MSAVSDSSSQRLLQEVLSQVVHLFGFLISHHQPQKDNTGNCPAVLLLSPQFILSVHSLT